MADIIYTSQFKKDFKKLRLNDADESRFVQVVEKAIGDGIQRIVSA